jgi:hypothetical protein
MTWLLQRSPKTQLPYSQIMQKMSTSFEHMLENASSPEVVAAVVLNAITAENPSLRYLAGKDAEMWLEAKRNMSDDEFYKMMKQSFN